MVWQVDTGVSEETSASAFKVLCEEGAASFVRNVDNTYTVSRAGGKFSNLSELKTCKLVMFQTKITPLNKSEAFKRINF